MGGGAVGCGVARRLSRSCQVTLVERGPLGGEATWAAAGILAPQAEFSAPSPLFSLACKSRDLWPAFADELGEVGYRQTGTLLLEPGDRWQWQRALGLRAERRGSSLFLPDDHQVEPRLLAARLSQPFRQGEAQQIVFEGGRAVGVLVDGELLAADQIVIAAGAWSSQLAGPPVRPLRGQMLELRAQPGLLPHVLYGEGGYLVPRADGRVLCGSSEDDVGFDKQVTPAVLARLQERAQRLEPRLAGAEVSGHWAGLRPATLDRRPLLGTVAPGLHLATAHHRHGILLLPITVEIVAALVTGETPPVDLTPFSPAREMHAPA